MKLKVVSLDSFPGVLVKKVIQINGVDAEAGCQVGLEVVGGKLDQNTRVDRPCFKKDSHTVFTLFPFCFPLFKLGSSDIDCPMCFCAFFLTGKETVNVGRLELVFDDLDKCGLFDSREQCFHGVNCARCALAHKWYYGLGGVEHTNCPRVSYSLVWLLVCSQLGQLGFQLGYSLERRVRNRWLGAVL